MESKEWINDNCVYSNNQFLGHPTTIFHGIAYDVYRIGTILEKGILSAENAKKELKDKYSENAPVFNKANKISVCSSTGRNKDDGYHAFNIWIKNGISFVIVGEKVFEAMRNSHESIRPDESIVYDKIKPDDIVGIMLPRESLSKKVSELNANLDNTAIEQGEPTWFLRKLEYIFKYLKDDLGYVADYTDVIREIKDIISKPNDESIESGMEMFSLVMEVATNRLNKIMQNHIAKAYSKKLGKKDVRLIDVIEMYNKKELPVYDVEDGIEIDLKEIIKEIDRNTGPEL